MRPVVRKKLQISKNRNKCRSFRVIGQKVLIKTATTVEKTTIVAVLSCFEQLTGWTKSVDKITFRY